MIKLIVSDVDGKLVEDGSGGVNPELFEVILKLREKGIQFAIASGRPWASVEGAFEPVKKKIFYIANNGAYLGCHGRSLFVNPIEPELVREVIEAVRRHPDLSVIYAGQDGDYMDSENDALYRWMLEGYKFNIRRVKDVLALEDPCIKISIYKEQDVEHAAADIREAFQDRMKITLAGEMWMDCMAQGVNKGQAVKRLQESLEIRPEETMAFGDQLNDIEMLQQAYYSFAVANAREEVRKLARFQADSNKNDGVLKVLKQLL